MRAPFFAILVIVLVVVAAVFLRIALAGHDAKVWHVEPGEASGCSSPNCFFMAPQGTPGKRIDAASAVYGVPAYEMAQAFAAFALAQRDTQVVAGTPEGLHMTFVQRSPRLRAPDYISVRFVDIDEARSTILVFSRSRFGYSDLGVNAERVKSWIGGLSSFEISAPVYADGQ